MVKELLNRKILDTLWQPEEIFMLINSDEDDYILNYADSVRKQYVGDEIHIRGIIEFSNYCSMNCLYCGLRRDNTKIIRYRLMPEDIINLAVGIKNDFGISTVVLQSGEDNYYTPKMLAGIIREIKNQTDMAVTVSIGERPDEDYNIIKEAGADRFLLKQETFNKELYHSLHPGASFENRIRCIQTIKRLGYQAGSGIIVGLPGQNIKHLAHDIFEMQKIKPDMASISPLIPHPNTPLSDFPTGNPKLTIKTTAIARIVMRTPNIPVTTALGVFGTEFQTESLKAGANVIMINFTPEDVKELYEIYPGKNKQKKPPSMLVEKVRNMILSINRIVNTGRGDSYGFGDEIK